jgi:hypothetical protein
LASNHGEQRDSSSSSSVVVVVYVPSWINYMYMSSLSSPAASELTADDATGRRGGAGRGMD